MSTEKLGVTVMELFAYNPYRILGIPVDSTQEEIDEVYNKLYAMAENDTISIYKSPFDFPSLPSFQRNTDSLNNAYSKLSGDVYRCFAFSESLYAVNLSQADISIQIANIDSYDKFLSCYMWLIINDPHIFYKNLWFKIAKHIDMLICANPEDWEKLFDHRFPQSVYTEDINSLKGFYNTFCEVILLPLKELVRGSLECMTASEILSNALFDGDISAFMSQLESSEKKVKRVGKKAPAMPEITNFSLVEEATKEETVPETEKVNLLEGIDEETNIYTDALNQMIKSNRARNQEIKSVDTSKVFGSGNLGKEEDVELTMSAVNSKTYDAKKLASPYEVVVDKNGDTNIDISDMLNPRINYTQKGAAQLRDNFNSAVNFEEVEKTKTHHKTMFIIKLTIFIIVLTTILCLGTVFQAELQEIVGKVIEAVKDIINDLKK